LPDGLVFYQVVVHDVSVIFKKEELRVDMAIHEHMDRLVVFLILDSTDFPHFLRLPPVPQRHFAIHII
jgi:hypothetical protein